MNLARFIADHTEQILDEWEAVARTTPSGAEETPLLREMAQSSAAGDRPRVASSDVLYSMSPDWGEMRQLHSPSFIASTDAPIRDWLQKYIPADDKAGVMSTVNDAIRTKRTFQLEHRVLRADGSVGWTFSRAVPILDANGEITEWFGAASDITERNRADEALQAAKADAEKASHAKDHFIATLAHELRTPLTPVMAATELLQRQRDLSPEARQRLEIIRRNVQLQARLIDDLLDLTRIAKGKLELHRQPINICTVIERAVEIAKPDIDARRLHFAVAMKDPPHRIDADAPRLQQVVWNLLSNAVKFTPEGGCVGLRCEREGERVVVEVSDSGIGIEPEACERIFDAFEQGSAVSQGSSAAWGWGLRLPSGWSKCTTEQYRHRAPAGTRVRHSAFSSP